MKSSPRNVSTAWNVTSQFPQSGQRMIFQLGGTTKPVSGDRDDDMSRAGYLHLPELDPIVRPNSG